MKSKKVSMLIILSLMIAVIVIGVASAASTTVIVNAKDVFTDTGLTVKKGQTVYISTPGQTWKVGDISYTGFGSNLYVSADTDGFYDEAGYASLIASVGSDPLDHYGDKGYYPKGPGNGFYYVGVGNTITFDRDGELWLGINAGANSEYSHRGTLSGYMTATISDTPPSSPTDPYSSWPSINVYAKDVFTDTGLTVKKGQTINLVTPGQTWKVGDISYTGSGSNLYVSADTDGFYDGAGYASLIASVGSDPLDHYGDKGYYPKGPGNGFYYVGVGNIITFDRDGELWLGINAGANSEYSYRGALSGYMTVKYKFQDGQTSIPEFPSITLPVAAILGLVVIFGRKKNMV